jgi:acetylornithine/succinyldiaminopimelate/putrescine aminotransferase
VKGLMLGVQLQDEQTTSKFISELYNNLIIVDQFLFCSDSFRIAPPLTISSDEIEEISKTLIKTLEKFS